MAVIIATGFTGTTYPMKNGRICWNWYQDGTPAATGSATGFPASNALPVRTDNAWRPDAATGTWTLDYPSARNVSFIGIAKHDLGTQNTTISIEYSSGGAWQAFAGASAISPADDAPILFLAPVTSVDGVRVVISAADAAPTISVIMVGLADEWPRPFVWTGQPITEGDRITFDNTIAVTGNWLGRSRVSDGLQFDVTMQHASEAWRQTTLKDFKSYANGADAAFFIALRPDDYPEEVAYAWATGVVRAAREMSNNALSTTVSMTLQGLRPQGG